MIAKLKWQVLPLVQSTCRFGNPCYYERIVPNFNKTRWQAVMSLDVCFLTLYWMGCWDVCFSEMWQKWSLERIKSFLYDLRISFLQYNGRNWDMVKCIFNVLEWLSEKDKILRLTLVSIHTSKAHMDKCKFCNKVKCFWASILRWRNIMWGNTQLRTLARWVTSRD